MPTGPAPAPTLEGETPYFRALRTRKLKYSHELAIDAMLLNPLITREELAQMMDMSPMAIHMLLNSDAFKRLYAQRKKDLLDPTIAASLEERVSALASRSLEVLQEKLSAPASAIDPGLALRAAELGLKASGVGGFGVAKAPPAPAPSTDALDRLASRLTNLIRPQAGEVVDVTSREIPQSS